MIEENIGENLSEEKPKCPECGSEYDAQEDIFCSNCGNELKFLCPKCKLEYEQKNNFCSNCGYKLNPEVDKVYGIKLIKIFFIGFVGGIVFVSIALITIYIITTTITNYEIFNPEIKSSITRANKLNIKWEMVFKYPDKYIGEPVIFYCTVIGKETGNNNYTVLTCISGPKNHLIKVYCPNRLSDKANLGFGLKEGFRKILGKIKEVHKSEIVVEGLHVF